MLSWIKRDVCNFSTGSLGKKEEERKKKRYTRFLESSKKKKKETDEEGRWKKGIVDL